MSLLSINHLSIVVAEHAVYATCSRGLFKPQLMHEKAMLAGADSDSVRLAITQVCKPFAQWQMWRCVIYFADSHVHYVVLPKVDLQLSYAEKMDYARSMVINYWGDVAKHWPLRLQDHLHQQSTLVSCIPCLENLDIQTVLGEMRPLILNMQPYSANLISQLQTIPAQGYLMVLEPNAIRLFLLSHGVCEYVSTLPIQVPSIPEMVRWLQRVRTLHQHQSKACYLVTENTQKSSMRKVLAFKNALDKALVAEGLTLGHIQTKQSLIGDMQGGFHV